MSLAESGTRRAARKPANESRLAATVRELRQWEEWPLPVEQPNKILHLIYCDSAGVSDTETICSVAAVVVHENQWRPIDRGLLFLLADFLKEFHDQIPAPIRTSIDNMEFEFHGSALFRGSEGWGSRTATKNLRYELLRRFLGLLAIYNLPIIETVVLKPELAKKPVKFAKTYSHEELAYMFVFERVERFFRRSLNQERGLLLCDRGRQELAIRDLVNQMRIFGAPIGGGAIGRRQSLDHLVETVHFADSHSTWGLQLADCCAFFRKRVLLRPDDHDAKEFYELIKPAVKLSRIYPAVHRN